MFCNNRDMVSAGSRSIDIELGRLLRVQRQLAHKTLNEVARPAGMSDSKLSRIELGRLSASELDVFNVSRVLALSPALTDRLVSLVRAARRVVSNDDVGRVTPEMFFVLDERSSLVQSYSIGVIPGLLQTPAYAKAVFEASSPFIDNESSDAPMRLFQRMRRHAFLYDGSKRFQFLLSESVLRNKPAVGVMSAVYDRIVEMMERENVEIGILPMSRPMLLVPGYRIYDERLVVVDGFPADHVHDEPSVISAHIEMFRVAWNTRLDHDDSMTLLQRLKQEVDDVESQEFEPMLSHSMETV